MKQYSLMRKYLIIGVILIFIEINVIPSTTSELTNGERQTNNRNIITVDDEPGDADFISIKEAVNASNPGDTIEVYSGIYREDGIQIMKENVSLQGISHELGNGNDSGKPFIKPDGTATVIRVEANHVHISNFRMEKLSSSTCITLGAEEPNRNQNNNTIMDCYILNPFGKGISFQGIGRDITIFNNTITGCTHGISADSVDFTIQANVIIGIEYDGIKIAYARGKNISYNTIKSCGTGINIYQGSNNILYGNDIRSCHTGILNYLGTNNKIYTNNIEDCPIGFSNEGGGGNHITHNNFQECWNIVPWFKTRFLDFVLNKDNWDSNYWEIWLSISPEPITHPKIIPGIIYVGIYIPGSELPFVIPLLWFAIDWHPTLEPYDIPGMSMID